MIQINSKEKQKELIMLFDWNWCPWKVEHLREFLEWVTWQSCHYYNRDITRYRQGNDHLSRLGPFVLVFCICGRWKRWITLLWVDFWLLKSVPPLYVSECIWPACLLSQSQKWYIQPLQSSLINIENPLDDVLLFGSELPNTAAPLDWIATWLHMKTCRNVLLLLSSGPQASPEMFRLV